MDKGTDQNLDKGKNQSLDKLIQPIGQLEPSDNHQEISKDISSSKKRRESYKDFKKRIIEIYAGHPLVYGPKGFKSDTLIRMSESEFLFNTVSNKDLNREDAIDVWQWLYVNQEKLLPIKKEETA